MKLNKLLVFLFIVGIIASGIVAFERMTIESTYKNYEVDFFYNELEKIAQQENKSIDEYLNLMKDTGIRNMLIKEDTIQSLITNPKYKIKTYMDGFDMIIESDDSLILDRIYKGFDEVKREGREVKFEDKNIIRVVGKSSEQIFAPVSAINNYGKRNVTTAQVWSGSILETVGLGYDSEAIEKAQSHGYGIVLVPSYNPDFQDEKKSIELYFKTLEDYNISPTHIIFSGNNVLGYSAARENKFGEEYIENNLAVLAKGLEDRNIAVAFIESSSQGSYLDTEGIKLLAKMMEFEATGSYLTWDFIQTKYNLSVPGHHNGEEITNVFFRGITTRNIRVIALRPFIDNGIYIADPAAYKNVLGNLEARLKIHNIVPGNLTTMQYFDSSNILKILISAGITSIGLIILDNLFSIRRRYLYILLALSILISIPVYLKIFALKNILSKIFAILGSVVMPVVAIFISTMFTKLNYSSKNKNNGIITSYSKSLIFVTTMMCVCFVSALFEIAMLSNSRYLLGLDSFSGVKISQMLPLLMVPFVYIAFYGYKRDYKVNEIRISSQDFRKFLNDEIKIWQVLAMGLTSVILLLFMVRSGNTSGEPSIFEVILRNVLEFVFPARPRTKAIFIGIPSLMLLIYNSYRLRAKNFAPVLLFFGSISFVNMVNTFSHMKAPIYLSLYRTGAEIVVGGVVSLMVILFIEFIIYIKNKGVSNV